MSAVPNSRLELLVVAIARGIGSLTSMHVAPIAEREAALRHLANAAIRQADALKAGDMVRARRDGACIRVELPGFLRPTLLTDADAQTLRDQLDVALHIPPPSPTVPIGNGTVTTMPSLVNTQKWNVSCRWVDPDSRRVIDPPSHL
ncbi:MAG: hypothetical protein ACYCZD_12950 [Rhodanobacter sp.]